MSFYENSLTWPFYLFIYTPHPLHLLLSLSNCTVEGPWYRGIRMEGHTPFKFKQKNNCQKTVFSININDSFPSSICSIDHLALSSINLQNALFKLLINTLIDLQKCHHTEARAADGSEPTAVQLPTVRKWWMSEWMCILQSARQCRWFLGWGMQVN